MSKRSRGRKGAQPIPPEGRERKTTTSHSLSHINPDAVNHGPLLSDKTYYNLFFHLPSDSMIGAHSYVVSVRCGAMLQKGVKKKRVKKNEIRIDVSPEARISENALIKCLEYVYTGKVNDIKFDTLTPVNCIHLMNAAALYGLTRLLEMSSVFLQSKVTMNNIYELLRIADDLKMKAAKDICLDFALQTPQFIANKDGVKLLGIELFQEAVLLFQNPPERLPPLEINSKETIVIDFAQLFDKREETGDVSFRIHTSNIPCHKAILAAASEPLANLIKATSHPVVVFPEESTKLSPEAFLSLLKWLYFGDDNIEPLEATQLITFSKEYDLPQLKIICEGKIKDGIAPPTVLSILKVVYDPIMEENRALQTELKERCLDFIVTHMKQVNFAPLERLPVQIAVSILQRIQQKWDGVAAPGGATPQRTATAPPPTRPAPQPQIGGGWHRMSGNASAPPPIDPSSLPPMPKAKMPAPPPTATPPPPNTLPQHPPEPLKNSSGKGKKGKKEKTKSQKKTRDKKK